MTSPELLWLNRWMWGNNITELKKQACNHHINSRLEDLKTRISQIPYSLNNSNTVFGAGNSSHPDIMIIGEAPGEEEDKSGIPFIGRSGKLVDAMLFAMNIKREDIYITNILPWRPPGNRTPTTEEIEMMTPYILECIDIIKPKIILLLGSAAAKSILKLANTISVTEVQGKWFSVNDIPTIATYHPSYMMRIALKKRDAWVTLCKIMELLEK